MRYLFGCFLLWFCVEGMAQTGLVERLEKHVYTLADDSLKGRKAGTDDSRRAADYIVGQWKEIGIEPFFKTDSESSYYQCFYGRYINLVGVIEGNDPALKDEYIVLGAHYDHLGVKLNGGDSVVYNGADDNASGTATVIELARELKAMKLGRSIIIAAFDGEELGLYGSSYFADNNGNKNIVLMLSIDMVGRYKNTGKVEYEGVGTIRNGRNMLLGASVVPAGLKVKIKTFENSILTATDTEGFAKKGIPTLAVTTGLHKQYHKPTDDAELIDFDGMALITEHLKNFLVEASQSHEYKASGKVAAKHRDERPVFTKGLTVNIGSNHLFYTEGALDGKSAGAYGIGLISQLNFASGKWLALRPELLYDYLQAEYPDGKIKSHCFTVPLSLVLQTKNPTPCFDVFFGGYYRHFFNNKLYDRFFPNEAGLNMGADMAVGPLRIGYVYRNALKNFNRQPVETAPLGKGNTANLRHNSSYFNIAFSF